MAIDDVATWDPCEISDIRVSDPISIASVRGGNGWNPAPALWDRYLAERRAGLRTVLVAWDGGRPGGYASLVWSSGHHPFRERGIPEINDLCVAARSRGRGIATALIRVLEGRARAAGRTAIGIGVGLHADYGPAQRLYAKLGYVPDGTGVTYLGATVEPGGTVRLDDELVLWLFKAIR